MKYFLWLFLVFTVMFSCQKTPQGMALPPPTIYGQWHIITDSIYMNVDGLQPSINLYKGTSGDFFDFGLNGNFTWHEQSMGSDSGYYSYSNSVIAFGYFPVSTPNGLGVAQNFNITLLTGSNLVLTNGPLPLHGPSGYAGEVLRFSR